jgi:L-threonylcarbamoyladenylate synthase
VVFFPETFEALSALQKQYRLFIVTNQSGVAKGDLDMDSVQRVNQHIADVLREKGIEITDTYVCPHQREDHCVCIKPNSFFLEKAATYYGIDLRRSFSVGDHPCDAQLAAKVGGKGIYILTGHGHKHRHELPPAVTVLPNIKAAADWILSRGHAQDMKQQAAGICQAAEVIRRGGLVAFPTETVYGLGANALNIEAVARIYEVKRRPHFDPLIVHIASCEQAEELVAEFPQEARRLTDFFWPGPLTVILSKSKSVPDIVTSGLPTVAIRMPAHPVAQDLIQEAKCPVAAPSANLFGTISPTCAEHVRRQFGRAIDFILDGGPCSVGVESTIVSLAGPRPVVLRPGGITVEQIESVIGRVEVAHPSDHRPLSPGRLERHYAPSTPLRLVDAIARPPQGIRAGLLSLGPTAQEGFAAIEVLSPTGSLPEAAANLFAAMRRLDEAGLDLILATDVPQQGVGRAINDRLHRAAQKPTANGAVPAEDALCPSSTGM